MGNWQIEFPDFPAADMPPIRQGWSDVSWHNDICPSFVIMTGTHGAGDSNYQTLTVWIAESDPVAREYPEQARFQLTYEGLDSFCVLTTDHWQDVLAYVDQRANLAVQYVKRVGYNPFLDDPTLSPEIVAQTLAEMESFK